ALYLPDMPFELDLGPRGTKNMTGPTAVGAFLDASVARFEFFVFVPVNTVIELYPEGDEDAATARFWMREDRHESEAADHAAGWSTAHGVYLDDYRRVDGRWWFSRRRYRSLARTGPDSAVLEFPDLD
ncbi:MAG: nuclear transport factor 2 family protein, partial [Microthrixaceae bacterium]